jgi:hypothetical protein
VTTDAAVADLRTTYIRLDDSSGKDYILMFSKFPT